MVSNSALFWGGVGGVPCLFQKQIPTQVPQRQDGQSVWPLLRRAQEKRSVSPLLFVFGSGGRAAWSLKQQRFRTHLMSIDLSVGGSVSVACANSSPRTHRASRPLSAVFQSLQPPSLWKNKKGSSSLTQVDDHPINFSHFKLAIVFSIMHIEKLHFLNLLGVVKYVASWAGMSGTLDN